MKKKTKSLSWAPEKELQRKEERWGETGRTTEHRMGGSKEMKEKKKKRGQKMTMKANGSKDDDVKEKTDDIGFE